MPPSAARVKHHHHYHRRPFRKRARALPHAARAFPAATLTCGELRCTKVKLRAGAGSVWMPAFFAPTNPISPPLPCFRSVTFSCFAFFLFFSFLFFHDASLGASREALTIAARGKRGRAHRN